MGQGAACMAFHSNQAQSTLAFFVLRRALPVSRFRAVIDIVPPSATTLWSQLLLVKVVRMRRIEGGWQIASA
jgi:hypothetical protein